MRDWFEKNFTKAIDGVAKGFASGIASVSKEWEIFAYGRQVTGRSTNITIDSPEEKSPGEKLGWALPGEAQRAAERDRHPAPTAPKGPERGIDL